MKTLNTLFYISLLLSCLTTSLAAQDFKKHRIISHLPSYDTQVNGLAIGLASHGFEQMGQPLSTQVNGITIELIGLGLILPMAPGSPIYHEEPSWYQKAENIDTLVWQIKRGSAYEFNGIALSVTGMVNPEAKINGMAISGFASVVQQVNGLNIAPINMVEINRGISVGLYNASIQTHGIQIGLFNKSKRLRGIQIGLFNVNEKRSLPFINWNFSRN